MEVWLPGTHIPNPIQGCKALKSLVKNLEAEKRINSIKIKSDSFYTCTDTPQALHKSIEKITSPTAFQTNLNKCIAINVYSKIDIKRQNVMKERENGDWSSVLHSEGIWRRETCNLAGWNWIQRRGTKPVNKMLGKNKELNLSFKKQMKKDIINRSWKLLKD